MSPEPRDRSVTIETERLLLRPPEDSDLDSWTAMLIDAEVARFLGPPIDSREAVAAHIQTARQRHETDGFGFLTVVRKEDGRVIGRSGFLVWDSRTWTPTSLRGAGSHAEIELGWTLARDCWGLGYASEAAEACRDYALTRLNVRRIIAVIQPGNARSITVARRLGMKRTQDIRTANGFVAQLWAHELVG
jgi:RimJ/RimL family protein N-acetyltransferase